MNPFSDDLQAQPAHMLEPLTTNGSVRPQSTADHLLLLPRSLKRTLAVLADASLCLLTVWMAICFRFEAWVSLAGYQWLAVVLSIALALPLLAFFGFYDTVIRFAGAQVIQSLLRAMAVYVVIYAAIFTAYGLPLVPRTIGVLQPLLLLIGLSLLRIVAKHWLGHSASRIAVQERNLRNSPAVLIYGAGNSGQQLAASLASSGQSKVMGFIEDNQSLQHARIAGVPVFSPQELNDQIQRLGVSSVFMAMPNLSRQKRNEILKLLSGQQVSVRTLPSLSELAQGQISERDLQEVDIDDLLGRDPVKPQPSLLEKNITGKTVLVTGAGGSIGSELCRQIVRQRPARLVLLEISEYALYRLNEELHAQKAVVPIDCVLADVQNETLIHTLIGKYAPQTIYHAAAYKHVPLVESNPIAGLKNNVLGTLYVARAALKNNVQDMVLISTDKAVRPTNVMGASKRLAEMCLQALADENKQKQHSTRFSMVRFGNVLGSSGSVVPKFREQIKAGGPVTITHPEITRFFMTIPEAAQLVLQAAALTPSHAQGAAVFLLDMGESVRIVDLAKLMIQLSGHTARSAEQPEGDISIEFTGLRPGEKLYEELLVSAHSEPTAHKKIFHAFEDFHSWQDLQSLIVWLQQAHPSEHEVGEILTKYEIGYQAA